MQKFTKCQIIDEKVIMWFFGGRNSKFFSCFNIMNYFMNWDQFWTRTKYSTKKKEKCFFHQVFQPAQLPTRGAFLFRSGFLVSNTSYFKRKWSYAPLEHPNPIQFKNIALKLHRVHRDIAQWSFNLCNRDSDTHAGMWWKFWRQHVSYCFCVIVNKPFSNSSFLPMNSSLKKNMFVSKKWVSRRFD